MTKILTCQVYFSMTLIMGVVVLGSTVTYADHKKKKYKNLSQLRKSLKVLPLLTILKKVRPLIKGEIIETEFEMEDGIPIYEFKYINKKGHVMEMEVDARTGRVIKVERD